jgi:hypothetical protein
MKSINKIHPTKFVHYAAAVSVFCMVNTHAETLTMESDLNVEGMVTFGNTELTQEQVTAGSIRWTGSAFEGYDGTSWNVFPLSVFNYDGTTSWGRNTSASGNFSTAWGNENEASGRYATAWGYSNTASGENAAVWGRENIVEGDFSNAWGFKNTVDGINVTAWGRENAVAGKFSTVWGVKNTVNGLKATSWGQENTANGQFSTVWGFRNNTDGLFATAWGRYVNAPASFSTVFGKFNLGGVSTSDDGDDSNEGASIWLNNDPLLEIGAGDNAENRANALTLLKDGRIALGKHTTLDALQTQLETVQIQGALKVGDYTTDPGANASEGTIRFGDDGNGMSDLLGYVDGTWKSLTQNNSSGGTDQTLSVNGDQLTISGAGGNTVNLPTGTIGGTNGLNGAIWLTGAGAPDDTNGSDRDLYLDTTSGDYFVKTSGTWGSVEGNLKGADGTDGVNGTNGVDGTNGKDGATWLTGVDTPDDVNGTDGDLYLDTTNGNYFIKASGTWGSSAGNLIGPQGIAGADGEVGPQGSAGDSYFAEDGGGDISLASANLGLGTATPTARLDVVGDTKISGLLTVDGGVVLAAHQGDIPMYQPTAP